MPLQDAKSGEVPWAFVVLETPGAITQADICDHVAQRAARHKHLARVDFVDEIPKNPTGKILLRLLRDRPVD